MNKIPTHKNSEMLQGEIAMFRYVSELQSHLTTIDYAHKDEYYIFVFMEEGHVKLSIDFKEIEFHGCAVHCMLPGHVHFPKSVMMGRAWILATDGMLIKNEYKELFEKVSFLGSNIQLDEATKSELRNCALAIQRRMTPDRQHIEQSILNDLLSYYIGLIAEVYQKGLPVSANNRFATITFEFKSLLSANFQSKKRSSEYAELLNISPAYLNEAVKKTTGLTVSDWILKENVLQAKRLLYYTDMSVKEIALELGYEDWAYFTRLFTKASNSTPTQFRKDNRK